jgi:hypothetical protein
MSDPDVLHGGLHNMILSQSRDSAAAARDMPSLMVSMLREDGWRVLVRPKDGRRFEHRTIDDWVLGPTWAGLHWPNWETLYGVLRTNTKDGPEAIRLLIAAGAPKPEDVDRELLVKKAKADGNEVGQGTRTDLSEPTALSGKLKRGTGNRDHILRRLARTSPETLAAYQNGGMSAAAAAKAAGIAISEKVSLGKPKTVAARIIAKGEDYAREIIAEMQTVLGEADDSDDDIDVAALIFEECQEAYKVGVTHLLREKHRHHGKEVSKEQVEADVGWLLDVDIDWDFLLELVRFAGYQLAEKKRHDVELDKFCAEHGGWPGKGEVYSTGQVHEPAEWLKYAMLLL